MVNFIRHWKKGWKFLLLELCLAFAYGLIFLPAAIIAQVILNWGRLSFYIMIVVVGVILVPAVTQYIFEIFYGPHRQQQNKQ